MIITNLIRIRVLAIATIWIGLLTAVPAFAGGLYITEFGQPSMGTSGAGWNVLAEDASTGVANPAGIFWMDSDSEWMVAGMYVSPSMKFRVDEGTTIPGNDGGDAGVSAIGGSVFHARKLSDKWALGFGVNSISAAAIDYREGFVGRHWSEQIDLLTITATANIAYKVNDSFALSAGIPMMFGSLDMDVAIPPVLGPVLPERDGLAHISNGTDFSATISLGAFWQVNEKTRLAWTFLGENKLDFGGDLDLTLPGVGGGTTIEDVNANVKIPFAHALAMSMSRNISERTTLLATVGWEDWSTMDKILISTSERDGQLYYDWEDTWKFALGFRVRGNGPWTFYTGAAYDTSPTSAYKRTADMPIDRQLRLSFGASYHLNSGKTVNGSFTYADYGDARIDNSNAGGTVVGEFTTNRILFFAVSLNW